MIRFPNQDTSRWLTTTIGAQGTTDGNFNGVNYPADDPDCWWTATKCVTPKAQGIPADIAVMPEVRNPFRSWFYWPWHNTSKD